MVKKSAFKRTVAASLLSVVMALSNTSAYPIVYATAEGTGEAATEPTPSEEPKQEVESAAQETPATETPATVTEGTPSQGGTPATPASEDKPSDEGGKEEAKPSQQEATPTETPATPDAGKQEGKSVEPKPTEQPKEKEVDEQPEETATPEPTETPEAEPDEDETKEEPEQKLTVFYAESVAEYTAAVSQLSDDADRRLLVTTGDNLENILTKGKAVYYAGTYIIEYDSYDERNLAYDVVSAALGANGIVVKDSDMMLCETPEGEPEGTPSQESEPAQDSPAEDTPSEETPKDAEPEQTEEAPAEEPVEQTDAEYTIEVDPNAVSIAEEGLTIAESFGDEVKVIALIDTGVNDDLADISVNLTEDPDADANGHGTQMARIIKERGRDKASIISIKAFNDNGGGSLANVTAAMKYAIEADVDIINISAAIRDSERTEAFKNMINLALSKGIIVVAAAGNNGRPAAEYVPANIAGVDTIGAAFPMDYSSAFSATPFSNYGDSVDYWYIATSTSIAAAEETGVLAAGWQDQGYEVTNKWFRFSTVMNRDGGAAEVQDLYDIGSEYGFVLDSEFEMIIQGVNPPGSGNIDADRSGAHWAGDHYEGTVFRYKPTGEQVFCLDPAHYADYDAWYEPAGYESPFRNTATYTYPDAKYKEWAGSDHIHNFEITLTGPTPALTNGKYLPGVEYVFTNTASNSDFPGEKTLSGNGYYVSGISVASGNKNAVRAWISGNEIHCYINPDEPNMPDDFSVLIATDKQINGSVVWYEEGVDKYYTHLAAGSAQAFSLPGSLAGQNGHYVTGSGFEGGGSDTYLYGDDETPETEVIRGGIAFDKDDFDRILSGETGNAQGDATLAGTEFTITNTRNRQVVAKVETNAEGKPATVTYRADNAGVGNLDGEFLKWGDYRITETKAPEGYHLNPDWSFYFEVRNPNGQIYNAEPAVGTNGGKIDQTVIRGGVKVTKYDTERYAASPDSGEKKNTAQGSASLEGAEYTITNNSADSVYVDSVWYKPGEVVKTLVTNADGFATTTNRLLPYGTYTIKETKAPEGYILNDAWSVTFKVTEEGKIYDSTNIAQAAYVTNKTDGGHDYVWDDPENGVITPNFMMDDVIRGGVKFQKTERERVFAHQEEAKTKTPQGDGTLEGTVISIISDNANSVYVQGAWYKKGATVATLVTNAEGYVETATDLLPYGKYHAIETQAPVGYLINQNWRFDFEITEDGAMIDGTNEGANNIQEQVIRGDVRVYKYDYDLDASEVMDGSMHKAETAYLKKIAFDIYNESLTSIMFTEDGTSFEEVEPGAFVTRIYTAWDSNLNAYVAQTYDKALSYGTYSIVELSCEDSDTNTFNMEDAELADSANNAYRFTDREKRYFQIGNHSYGPVTLDTNIEEVDGVYVDYGSAESSKNYQTKFSSSAKELLTFVTYDGKTAVTNHVSFWNNDGDNTSDVSNPMSDLQEANGTVLNPTGNAEADKTMIFKNQIKRNDFRFIKKMGTGDQRGLQTMWVLRNVTSGERHVLITNTNGEFNSTAKAHTKDTNVNDKFFAVIDKGQPVTIAKGGSESNFGLGDVSIDYGIWFGIGEDGTESTVEDSFGALPYGDYVLDEVRTDTNEGLELVHKSFSIKQDKTIYAAGYDLGSIFDYGITMESELLITDTNSHIGKADTGKITLKDTVTYDGVRDTGKEYVLEGKLMDKDTMEVLKDENGNEITSITRVTINANQGTITGQQFEIDTANMSGKRIVAYEYLWPADVYDEKH